MSLHITVADRVIAESILEGDLVLSEVVVALFDACGGNERQFVGLLSDAADDMDRGMADYVNSPVQDMLAAWAEAASAAERALTGD